MPLTQLSAHSQSLPPLPKSKLDPSGVDSLGVGLCMFQSPMVLSIELSCEAGSLSCHHNPHIFLQPEILRLYFFVLEPQVAWSVLLPRCSPWFVCMQMQDGQLLPCLPGPLDATLPCWLPVFAPPTSLDVFIFYFLGVSPPCCSILCQFWLCEEAQCDYLRRHLGSPQLCSLVVVLNTLPRTSFRYFFKTKCYTCGFLWCVYACYSFCMYIIFTNNHVSSHPSALPYSLYLVNKLMLHFT